MPFLSAAVRKISCKVRGEIRLRLDVRRGPLLRLIIARSVYLDTKNCCFLVHRTTIYASFHVLNI